MNTPLKGIVIVASFLLAVCLIGAGVIQWRKIETARAIEANRDPFAVPDPFAGHPATPEENAKMRAMAAEIMKSADQMHRKNIELGARVKWLGNESKQAREIADQTAAYEKLIVIEHTGAPGASKAQLEDVLKSSQRLAKGDFVYQLSLVNKALEEFKP